MTYLGEADREALREPVFFEGQADGLRGVGAPRMPFPVLEMDAHGELRPGRPAGLRCGVFLRALARKPPQWNTAEM